MTTKRSAGSALQKTPAASSRPQDRTCSGCGAAVLRARTTSGLEVEVAAAALSPLGELAALLAGVSTYTWHRIPDHLAHRYPLVIRGRPAGTPRQSVHALHRCGDSWPALDSPGRAPATHATHDDAPPY